MTAPSFFLTVSTDNFHTWTHINQTALAESDPTRTGSVESFLPCESQVHREPSWPESFLQKL